MAQLPIPELVTHSQKVCRLYKKACRNIYSYMGSVIERRYHLVLLRARFDKNKDIKDLRLAKHLYLQGEAELKKIQHPQPLVFPDSPTGPAYGRECPLPDWVLDYWDPIEKAMYPKYFALREQRKKEFIEHWNKNLKPKYDSAFRH